MFINRLPEIKALLSSPYVTGASVAAYLNNIYQDGTSVLATQATSQTVSDNAGNSTEIVISRIQAEGATQAVPGLVIAGQGNAINLAGGAELISEADGILCALTVAASLLDGKKERRPLSKDVVIVTQIKAQADNADTPPVADALIQEAQLQNLEHEGILSLRSVKADNWASYRGFGLTPPVLQGWILPISGDFMNLAGQISGKVSRLYPITMFDIPRAASGLTRHNNIIAPNAFTDKPVIGVAIAAEMQVPGSLSHASHADDIAETAAFVLEAIQQYNAGQISFYDAAMFSRAKSRYSDIDMTVLQKAGSAN